MASHFCFLCLNTDEDSDNEPLIKIAKISLKAVKKPPSVPTKKAAGRKKKGEMAFSPVDWGIVRHLLYQILTLGFLFSHRVTGQGRQLR